MDGQLNEACQESDLFLEDRLNKMCIRDRLSEDKETEKLETPLHKTIKKVSSDIEDMKFNTAIAALMTLTNDIYNVGKISKEQLHTFIKLLCPFAPHLCEEMWEVTGGEGFLSLASWPTYEEAKTVDAQTEIGVQTVSYTHLPIARRLLTITSIRLDSLTFSSCASRITVVPLAKQARAATTGSSSMRVGITEPPTVTP